MLAPVEVNDLNDHLAELVDTLDDMDGSVVQSDVDAKDPVLMSKRLREKFVKSEQLRGNSFKSGMVHEKPYNPWDDIKKQERHQRKLERQGIKEPTKEEKKKEAERKEWTAIQEAKQERARRREARKNQPPPPPLPLHLQRVKEEQRKSKEKSRIDQIRRIAAEEKRHKMNGF